MAGAPKQLIVMDGSGVWVVDPAAIAIAIAIAFPSRSVPTARARTIGSPVHVVAARLGHADPAITLRVYAHVLDDQASGAATTFEQFLNSNGGQPHDKT